MRPLVWKTACNLKSVKQNEGGWKPFAVLSAIHKAEGKAKITRPDTWEIFGGHIHGV